MQGLGTIKQSILQKKAQQKEKNSYTFLWQKNFLNENILRFHLKEQFT